jgi:hypothetical protein
MILYLKDPTRKILDLIKLLGQQDIKSTYKNQKLFCIPTMNRLRKKSEKQSYS